MRQSSWEGRKEEGTKGGREKVYKGELKVGSRRGVSNGERRLERGNQSERKIER